MRKETLDQALASIFSFTQTIASKNIHHASYPEIFDDMFQRCAIVVGYISKNNLKDIFRFVIDRIDKKAATLQSATISLDLLKYCFRRPEKEAGEYMDLIHYVKEVVILCEKQKKDSMRKPMIRCLERIVQPMDTKGERTPTETLIWVEIGNLYKKAKKWSLTEELREVSLALQATILSNSRIEFFAQNIDGLLNADLLGSLKNNYTHSLILQLLRGRYMSDTLEQFEEKVKGTFLHGRHYASLIRAPGEQSEGTFTNRLNVIAESLFFKDKFPHENIHVGASIVTQMASHNIAFGKKLVVELLSTSRVENSIESHFVGMKALRIILDATSGFQRFAISAKDPAFSQLVNEMITESLESISQIYATIDTLVGVANSYASGKVSDFDIALLSKKVNPLELGETGANLIEFVRLLPSHHDELDELNSMRSPVTADFPGLGGSRESIRASMRNTTINRSLSALAVSPQSSGSYLGMENEHDAEVRAAVTEWFKATGDESKPTRFFCPHDLVNAQVVKWNKKLKLKQDQEIALAILRELLNVVQLVPTPAFVGGNHFVGSFICHYKEDIAALSAQTMFKIFRDNSKLRLGMINGYLNYMKGSKTRDDTSICTHITFISKLINHWHDQIGKEGPSSIPFEAFDRVSCKMDAFTLHLMCHPSNQIRKKCLQVIFDLYEIQKKLYNQSFGSNELPVAEILLKSEKLLTRKSIFGFLDSCGYGHKVCAATTYSFRILSFNTVALSNYTRLFLYYHGELVKRFSVHARSKAIRRLAKNLKHFAAPMASIKFVSPSTHFMLFFESHMILMMAMAGISVTSDIPNERKTRGYNEARFLLFGFFKMNIPFLLTLDNAWQAKSVCKSMHFFHRDVGQLLVSELMQNFQEIKQNSNLISNSCFLDNLFGILRYLVQYPNFELFIDDRGMFNSVIVHTFSDFLSFSAHAIFNEVDFLRKGPVSKVKTALNYITMVERLSACLLSIRQKLVLQARSKRDKSALNAFDAQSWAPIQRKNVLILFNVWYETITEQCRTSAITGEMTQKLAGLKRMMLLRIGLAVKELMGFGGMFDNGSPLSPGLLPWLVQLQQNGANVFPPDFLSQNDAGLDVILLQSYISKDPVPFCNAILEQLLPRLEDGPQAYLYGASSKKITYSESYLSLLHGLPVPEAPELANSFSFPDIDMTPMIKLKERCGSLLFFALYNMARVQTDIRIRACGFLKELIVKVSADDKRDDILSKIAQLRGCLYAPVGSHMKAKVLELNSMFAKTFKADSQRFLVESVKCSRNLSPESSMLLNPFEWMSELVIPWCKSVNLMPIKAGEDVGDILHFLLDSAFKQNLKTENVEKCWMMVVSSQEFGEENLSWLMGK